VPRRPIWKTEVVDQAAVLPGAAEGAAVGDRLAEHGVVDVGMGVDMDQRDRPVAFLDRAQDRPGQRVVAAQRQRDRAVGEDAAVVVGDDVHGLLQVEGVDRHIADVGHLKMSKGAAPVAML
jgi:ribosomal protein L34